MTKDQKIVTEIERWLNPNHWVAHVHENGYPTEVLAKTDFLGMIARVKHIMADQENLPRVSKGVKKPTLSNDERLKANAEKGYILVCELPSGLELYKKQNESGAFTYYGESCAIFAPVWFDGLSSKEEFVAIAEDCYKLRVEKNDAIEFAEWIAKRNTLLTSAPKYGNGDYMWFITKDSIGQTTSELYQQFQDEKLKHKG